MEHFFQMGILPAVTIEDENKAVAVAKAILDGELNVMEIPFRTESAAMSIKKIKEAYPKLYVGAGTILTPEQVLMAKESGADFGLAPGFNTEVVKEAIKIDFPFVPGVMTPSEVELALKLGCTVQKIFPVSQVGGPEFLKALAGPYGHTGVKFIPMGGISLKNMNDYLNETNVIAIGGSWLATKELIEKGDYSQIKKNIKEAILTYKSGC